jgi:hypothetical protein
MCSVREPVLRSALRLSAKLQCSASDLASLTMSEAPSVKHAHTGHNEYQVTSVASEEPPSVTNRN